MTPIKPLALRLLEGDRGHRPLPKPGPLHALEGNPPEPPDWLSEEAQAIWRKTVEEIRATLMPGDEQVLILFCVAADNFRRAAQLVASAGILVRGRGGKEVVKNPADASARAWSARAEHLACELGLTPASRTRVIQGTAGTEDSRAARLLS